MENVDRELLETLISKLSSGRWEDFLDAGQGCNWCRHPVRIRGVITEGAGANRSLRFSTDSLPDGLFLKACGSRRETRCPACAHTYRADARHLVRAGLIGGKGVDASVALHPCRLPHSDRPEFRLHPFSAAGTSVSTRIPWASVLPRPAGELSRATLRGRRRGRHADLSRLLRLPRCRFAQCPHT
jgi:hypothetical protein